MAPSPVICFRSGTRIWTPDGEKRVEDFKINDLVVTSSGAAKPIRWVWGRSYKRLPGQKWPEEVVPVKVTKSALGQNTPHRDLFLSGYHCLYLDGALIPVMHLVNNKTISRCDTNDREIDYFHIKLERHSIIYAEGAACESLLAVTAANSDNIAFEEYKRLYGDDTPLSPDEPVAPLLEYKGGRERLHGRIRSAISPLVDIRSKLDIVRDGLNARSRNVRG